MTHRGAYNATPDTAVSGSSVPIFTDAKGRLNTLAVPTTNDGVPVTSANPLLCLSVDAAADRRIQEEILLAWQDIRDLLQESPFIFDSGPSGEGNPTKPGGGGYASTNDLDAIPGLAIWLNFQAANVTKDGSNRVSNVLNRGNVAGASAAVQATGAKQPLWLSSAGMGRDTIFLDGARYLTGTMAAGTTWTMVVAMQINATGTDGCVDLQPVAGVNAAGFTLIQSGGAIVAARNADGATFKAEVTGVARVFSCDTNGSAGHIWVDQATGAVGGAVAIGSCLSYTIGAQSDGTGGLVGGILEVAIYNSVLSTNDRLFAEAKMKQRWGI